MFSGQPGYYPSGIQNSQVVISQPAVVNTPVCRDTPVEVNCPHCHDQITTTIEYNLESLQTV